MCCNEVRNLKVLHMHTASARKENECHLCARVQNLVKKLISSSVWFIDDFTIAQ